MIDRRTVLKTGLAAAATGVVGTRVIAEISLGDGRLRTVSDGHLVLPESFVIGDLPAEEARALVEEAGFAPDGLEAPCNLTLWEAGDARVLFDAGSGPAFMPSAGEIVGNLEALGLAPGDITHVVFTHGHPDHLWGALDDFDEPLFLNAAHMMAEEEAAYWTDPSTLETVRADRQSFVAGASRRIEILGGGLERVAQDAEALPGVTLVPMPGHTPGHVGVRIAAGGEEVLLVGDAIGNGHLALARPEWPSPADHEPERAIETRMALLEELAASGGTFVGFHLPDGGMGRVAKDGDGYVFTAL